MSGWGWGWASTVRVQEGTSPQKSTVFKWANPELSGRQRKQQIPLRQETFSGQATEHLSSGDVRVTAAGADGH